MIYDRLGRSIWRGSVVVASVAYEPVLLYVARCHQRNWCEFEIQFMTLEFPESFIVMDGVSSVVGGYGRVIDCFAGARLNCEVLHGL